MANRKILTLMLIALIATFFPLSPSTAQNLPPSGAYQPIPNYTGTNAGLLFRNAINNRLSGAQPISPAIVSLSFANLPAEQDGTLFYCVDCQKVSPCGGGGAGAWAMGQNGAWSCATSASNLSMGGDVTGASNANTVSTVLGGKTPVVASGANAASGSSTAAALNGFNIAGRIDVTNPKYGAVCSTTTESAAATASNPIVTVGAIGDFKAGQYVKLDHAGASNTLATPTLTSVTLNGYIYNGGPSQPNFQYNTLTGQCNTDTATYATGHNTSCATVYGYAIRATGQTGIGAGLNGMWSARSNIIYVTGAAVLSVGNNNVLQWTDDANATGYVIQRCTGASCTPTGIQAVKQVGIIEGGVNPPADIYFDFGNGFGVAEDSEGSSASAWAADDDAQITNISGLSITLSVAPSQTGTFTMRHDDAPAFQSAVNASCLSNSFQCSAVYVPGCANPYPLSQGVSLWGMIGGGFLGANSTGVDGSPSQLQWDGPVGGRIINGNQSADSKISRLALEDPNNAPGAFIDINGYGTSSPSTQGPGAPASAGTNNSTPPTHWKIQNIECGGNVSLCVNFGGISNDENNIVDDVVCDTGFGSTGGLACFYSDSQETYNETINNINVEWRDFGVDVNKIGSYQIHDAEFYGDAVDIYTGTLSGTGEISGGNTQSSQMFLVGTGFTGVSNVNIGPMGSNPSGIVIGGQAGYGVWSGNVIGYCINPSGVGCDDNIGCSPYGQSCGTWIGDQFSPPLGNSSNSFVYPAQPGGLPFVTWDGQGLQPSYTAIDSGVFLPTPTTFVPYAQFIKPTYTNGTAGYAACTMNDQGTIKVVSCQLSGYQETGTAQTVGFASGGTITLPGINFATAPNVVQSSCANTGATAASATTSALTLPAGASMTAESCNITAMGQ
ncbi:MAG: hypothetical protein ACREQR_19900 [Candidatus Binataceae bacterium]